MSKSGLGSESQCVGLGLGGGGGGGGCGGGGGVGGGGGGGWGVTFYSILRIYKAFQWTSREIESLGGIDVLGEFKKSYLVPYYKFTVYY